jgi:hypothetical protein
MPDHHSGQATQQLPLQQLQPPHWWGGHPEQGSTGLQSGQPPAVMVSAAAAARLNLLLVLLLQC